MILSLTLPTEICLEISSNAQDESWRLSQRQSSPDSQWRAYLNQMALQAILPWLQEEWSPVAAPWPKLSVLPTFWEVVEGTAISLGDKRLVLLPTEAMDEEELRVPQEWLDIDSWAADYYFAVQVDPDEQWVRIWGCATHEQLKLEGSYNPIDRTYSLDGISLIRDITAFISAQQFQLQEASREALTPLPTVSENQAENILQRLAVAEVVFPRLSVPFELWGALIADENWRLRLYRQRRGQPSINLSQWFNNLLEVSWQSLEELFPDAMVPALISRAADGGESPLRQGKLITLAGPEAESVVLVVGLEAETEERLRVQIQLHPAPDNRFLPEGVRLALFSEEGELLKSVQAQREDNYIQIQRFRCAPSFRFGIEVSLDDFRQREDFVV